MKVFTFVSCLLAVAYAAPAELEAQEIQAEQAAPTLPGNDILPRLADSKPKDGAVRTPKNYGAFTIQSSKMVSTTRMAQGPCGAMPTCLVTAMEASIRYGRNFSAVEANADTGAWLHHIALFGTGAGGGSLWAAGNERPTLRLNTGSKYGLSLGSFMMIIDLMSEDTKPKEVSLFINYEHVPKTSGYKAASMYWLTIGEPPARQGVYSIPTNTMTVKENGKLLYAIGHMHDGGDNMELSVGGKVVCRSVMHYNARPGYSPGGATGAAAGSGGAKAGGSMAGMSHGHSRRDGPHGGHGGMHISDPGACVDFGEVKRGTAIRGAANYNAAKYGLMVHNGKKENIMGNMRVYVGPM